MTPSLFSNDQGRLKLMTVIDRHPFLAL